MNSATYSRKEISIFDKLRRDSERPTTTIHGLLENSVFVANETEVV